jgi:hypothetical protein
MFGGGGFVAFVGQHSSQVELGVAQIGAKADGFRVFMKRGIYLAFAL